MIGFASYLMFFLTITAILAIAVLGLNLQWGNAGIFNGGVVAFFGIGAYVMIILGGPVRAGEFGGFQVVWPIALLGGAAAAGALAYIVGLATTRLRHDYLAIATFGVAVAMEAFVRNATYLSGGAKGIRGFERPLEEAIGNPFLYNVFFLVLVVVALAVVYAGLSRLVASPYGRLLRAIREDETAAKALGKNPARVRLEAFIIGAVIMGLAGGLYATFYAFISPQDLAPILTFQIWAMLIVGGAGNNRGAVLGTFVVWGCWVASGFGLASFAPPHIQIYAGTIQYILIGLIIVIALLLRPRGLLPEQLQITTRTTSGFPGRTNQKLQN
ncbi:branched-chain amino acid ABC transporter permease [Hoeflea prorocentri]|uniref:Branched-chain amino acid ABC transporter permease n=1 Tax=Hoeflea prorocentri TaxID=1922333 RepID=A0A9X3ZJA4_9HYPH|nr:branched-chain amino acid ABC transporter permease [Hoeflea prorocentri]MCY6382605.1 branched-chain amino acid ABC transporter permease [Hoeflea prorocentri]MDA5400405.1 branched-chain amino acid ABC transporter permease [Hoeflea prorocentri]